MAFDTAAHKMITYRYLNILAWFLVLGSLPVQPEERIRNLPAEPKSVTAPAFTGIPSTIQRSDLIQKPLDSCSPSFTCVSNSKYRTINGTCNNLQNPRLGASNMPFFRYLTSAYEDGENVMRGEGRRGMPTPRQVSVAMSQAEKSLSRNDTSLLLMQWGQVLDHDLAFSPEYEGPCCDDRFNFDNNDQNCRSLDVRGDAFYQRFGVRCLPFHRSLESKCVSGPREQINEVTAFLDGSNVYGSTPEEEVNLRGQNGLMRVGTSGVETVPKNNPHCPLTCSYNFLPATKDDNGNPRFLAGDRRAQEQPGLTSMHTLFVRAHNDLAEQIRSKYPSWSSNQIYQETRRFIVAIMQSITYNEFLPIIIGPTVMGSSNLRVPTWNGYRYSASVVPHTANAFATAAFRFGHTLIADRFNLANARIELSRSFNNYGLTFIPFQQPSDFLEGIAHAQAENADHFMVESITNLLFAEAASGFRNGSDLLARNIQRGRDHGIPPYNNWRSFCSLPTFSDFTSLNETFPPSVVAQFQRIYSSVNDIDIFPALIAERPVYSDALVGPTLQCLIGKHFYQVKFGDRYWFETTEQPQAFTSAQLTAIRRTTLASLICAYTETPEIQGEAMRTPSRCNPVSSCLDVIPLGSLPDQILNVI